MKSGLILETLAAMEIAEKALITGSPENRTAAYLLLVKARTKLLYHSGIRDLELRLEKAE
tara:strand:+ start:512 stop:691 length:180 start_codon:yes stop_codon:yes gene_type:complete